MSKIKKYYTLADHYAGLCDENGIVYPDGPRQPIQPPEPKKPNLDVPLDKSPVNPNQDRLPPAVESQLKQPDAPEEVVPTPADDPGNTTVAEPSAENAGGDGPGTSNEEEVKTDPPQNPDAPLAG